MNAAWVGSPHLNIGLSGVLGVFLADEGSEIIDVLAILCEGVCLYSCVLHGRVYGLLDTAGYL